jgi:hypothetical protein
VCGGTVIRGSESQVASILDDSGLGKIGLDVFDTSVGRTIIRDDDLEIAARRPD